MRVCTRVCRTTLRLCEVSCSKTRSKCQSGPGAARHVEKLSSSRVRARMDAQSARSTSRVCTPVGWMPGVLRAFILFAAGAARTSPENGWRAPAAETRHLSPAGLCQGLHMLVHPPSSDLQPSRGARGLLRIGLHEKGTRRWRRPAVTPSVAWVGSDERLRERGTIRDRWARGLAAIGQRYCGHGP